MDRQLLFIQQRVKSKIIQGRSMAMIYKKLAYVAAAAVIGATLIAVPAQARFGGFGGGFGFGGFR